MTKRLNHFDLISGIFMLQIIFMHVMQIIGIFEHNYYIQIVQNILSFFMPWFYFKAGYFYKNNEKFNLKFVKDKTNKLLRPFIIFLIIGFIFHLPFELLFSDRSFLRIILTPIYGVLRYGSGGVGNLPIWFLLSLFLCFLTYMIIDIFKLKWLVIIFPFIGMLFSYFNIILPLGLSNLFLGVFFIGAGHFFKSIHNKFKIKFYIIVSLVYFLIVFFSKNVYDFRTNTLVQGHYLIFVLVALLGIITIIFFTSYIQVIKPINYVGLNSLIYFITHWIIILLVKNIFDFLNISICSFQLAMLMLMMVFFITPSLVKIFNSKLKFLISG